MTDKPNIWWRNLTDANEIKILFKGREIQSKINVEPNDSDYIYPKLNALFTHSRIDGFLEALVTKKESLLRKTS